MQHIQLYRLLHKCEGIARNEGGSLDVKRLNQFVGVLENEIGELETSYVATTVGTGVSTESPCPLPLDREVIRDYRKRVQALRTMVSKKQAQSTTATSAKEPITNHVEQNSGIAETPFSDQPEISDDQLPTRMEPSRTRRAFQFKKRHQPGSSGGRLTKEEQKEVQREKEVQRYLTSELSEMAAQLKDGSLAINQTLKGQNQILEETEKSAQENQEKVSKEGGRLQKYLSGQGLGVCEVIFLVLVVVAAFIFAYMFIKIFPKRQRLTLPSDPEDHKLSQKATLKEDSKMIMDEYPDTINKLDIVDDNLYSDDDKSAPHLIIEQEAIFEESGEISTNIQSDSRSCTSESASCVDTTINLKENENNVIMQEDQVSSAVELDVDAKDIEINERGKVLNQDLEKDLELSSSFQSEL